MRWTLEEKKQGVRMLELPRKKNLCSRFFFALFICPSFIGLVCVLDFFTVTIFWASFFEREGSHQRSWEMYGAHSIFLPFFFLLLVPFSKQSMQTNEIIKIKKKMCRMISQAWSCNLMELIFVPFKTSLSVDLSVGFFRVNLTETWIRMNGGEDLMKIRMLGNSFLCVFK